MTSSSVCTCKLILNDYLKQKEQQIMDKNLSLVARQVCGKHICIVLLRNMFGSDAAGILW